MGRPPKIRTAKQYAKDQERSAVARELIRASGVSMTAVCHQAARSYQTISTWLRNGLSMSQYQTILQAITDARADQEGR